MSKPIIIFDTQHIKKELQDWADTYWDAEDNWEDYSDLEKAYIIFRINKPSIDKFEEDLRHIERANEHSRSFLNSEIARLKENIKTQEEITKISVKILDKKFNP